MATSLISLNLGIDFGTRYTKICVRDTDRDESWVVIPGKAKNLLDRALILSQVGIQHDGTLLAGLTEAEWNTQRASCAVIIDFIKMRLAHLDPGREAANWYSPKLSSFQGVNLSAPNALENICAFFLYRVIERSKEWIYQNDSDRLKNVEVDWSATIGVPVEYCDSPALARFQRVLCLAWHLCELNINPITLLELNNYLNDISQSLDTENIPCFGVPEIAAAVYSYTFSRQAKQGVYIFFDIGGGTTEGAAFEFYRNSDDQLQIDFFSGIVEPIGINALAKRITQYSPDLELKVAKAIVNRGDKILDEIAKLSRQYVATLKKGDHIANKHRVSTRAIKEKLKPESINLYLLQVLILAQALIHRQVATVIRTCCQKLPHGQAPTISVFLGGGGKISEYYQDTIYATYDTFQLSSTGMPRYRMLDIPLPSDFSMKGIEEKYFHRFSIAYGLSIPDYQAPTFRLPQQFPETPPRPVGSRWIPETAQDDG